MKRRRFLLAAGVAGGGGLARFLERRNDGLRVKVRLSQRASEYDPLPDRIRGYLRRALVGVFDRVDIEFGEEPVALSAEEGRRVMAVEWPRMVIGGSVRTGRIGDVSDVNLLVTDGDPRVEPAGYGMLSIAAVSGARHLSGMPRVEETPRVVDHAVPAAVTQLLIHECGHAIGLGHRHGSVVADGDTITASPMVGGYAWSSGSIGDRLTSREGNACGQEYPDADGKKRRLALTYGPCARRAVRGSSVGFRD